MINLRNIVSFSAQSSAFYAHSERYSSLFAHFAQYVSAYGNPPFRVARNGADGCRSRLPTGLPTGYRFRQQHDIVPAGSF
jgi:hypothetical protein